MGGRFVGGGGEGWGEACGGLCGWRRRRRRRRRTIDDSAADGRDDQPNVDGRPLRRDDLPLARRPREFLRSALVVDALALVVPQLAHGASRRRRSSPARLALRPARLARRPAPRLVAVRRHLLPAPVRVLRDAVRGDLALVLLRLGARGARAVREVCDGRPGDLVLCVFAHVDVEFDGGLAGGHVFGAGDGDGGLRDEVAGGLEEDLRAARVELGGALGGVVQGDDFGAGEVVAALEAGGEFHGETPLVVDEAVGAPRVGIGVVPVVHELEPAVAGGLVVLCRVDFLEVDGAGAVVRAVEGHLGRVVGPGAHLEGERRPVFHRGDVVDALGAVDVAGHVVAGVVDERVRRDFGIHAHAEGGAVALAEAVDVEDGPDGVGEGRWGGQGGEEEGVGLHGVFVE